MDEFFHCAPILLGSGSIVLPGNYGRIIQATGPAHPLWNRESILETVRATHYPDKPSRFACAFAFSNEATASCYQASRDPRSILYRVEKVEPSAPEHRADFNVVQPLPGRNESMEEIAHLYWGATLWTTVVEWQGIQCEEVITSSPLRILGNANAPDSSRFGF